MNKITKFKKNNAAKEASYTSTGDKILWHKLAIKDLKKKKNHPIVMHIMPTEVCNLKCVFCSVAQRGAEGRLLPDLTMEQIKNVVGTFKSFGLKAVILSGGGDPTMFPQINELIEYLYFQGLQIGIITNGVALNRTIKSNNLKLLTWVRISINSFDYLPDIEIPQLSNKTVLGFSYIWNSLTKKDILERIREKIKQISLNNKVTYVRLLPDCNLKTTELEEAHKKLRKVAEELGEPFFHQYKTHNMPLECHLGRLHPVLYTDGYIYPCDSLVLNSPADDKKFHRDFALCRWDEVKDFYSKKIDGSLLDTNKCPHCVFARQNLLISDIIYGNELPPLGQEKPQHINFI